MSFPIITFYLSRKHNDKQKCDKVLEEDFGIRTCKLYRVSQKKRNGAFSVHCKLKVLYIFISLDRVSSAEENGT